MKPTLILINPWIYDFAAYDLWSKPLGLLYIAGYLRERGYRIHIIDCLDVHHPEMDSLLSMTPPVRRLYGTGKFWKKKIPKPFPLKHVQRSYSRYGITRQLFINELKKIKNPSAILVTSLMTYWYPGVREVINLAKNVHPGIPVILGGIYAKLCEEHARHFSGADYVAPEIGLHNMELVLEIMDHLDLPVPGENSEMSELLYPVYPAFDMLNKIDYVCIMTSSGCPYKCRYCASHFLNPTFARRDPEQVLEEIRYWHKVHGIMDFAFLDDALLVDGESHIESILEGILRSGINVRFHTPNGLHLREITPEIARLMYLSGFRTVRLGLETSDINRNKGMDNKVSEGEFEIAVYNLKKAGYEKRDIGAYILMGLPEQTISSVEDTIRFVDQVGASPYLAEYSPLPHTLLWEKAIEYSGYDLLNEPLYHNNSLLACWDEGQRQRVKDMKSMVLEIRNRDI